MVQATLLALLAVAGNFQIYDRSRIPGPMEPLCRGRPWRPSVRAISGRLYVFGGSSVWNNGGGDLADAQVYDPDSDSWSSVPDMPTSRYWTAAAVHDRTVHVFGGWGLDNDAPLATNESFSLGPPNPPDKEASKKGGWKGFGFTNQGQCVRFVQTGKDSR